MKYVILFLSIFLIVFIIYFLFVINRKKVLERFKNGKELSYLKYVYKLNYDKIDVKSLAYVIALSNAFILASTVTIVSLFNKFLMQMLIGLLTLFPLIIIIYHIIGKIYQNKMRRRK